MNRVKVAAGIFLWKCFLALAVCSQSLMALMAAAAYMRMKSREGAKTQEAKGAFLVILPAAGAVLHYAVYKIAGEIGQAGFTGGFFWPVIAGAALLAMNLSLYPAYMCVMEAAGTCRNLRLYKKHIELFRQEQFLEEAAAAEILELRHDMRQHLIFIRELLWENRKDEALDAVEGLIGSAGERGMLKSNTGNMAVDALVNHAWLVAAGKNIDFHARLGGLSGIEIPNSDLCILLGNALDNALEASEYVPERERAIWVEITCEKRCLLISLRNRYAGELISKGGRLHSKKEGRGHGTGLLSMKKTAARLNGTLTFEGQNGIFSLEIWIPCITGTGGSWPDGANFAMETDLW